MLEEIRRRPGASNGEEGLGSNGGAVTQDREGYALAAGLALGLVTLGRGQNAPGLSDILIADRLRWDMHEHSWHCPGTMWLQDTVVLVPEHSTWHWKAYSITRASNLASPFMRLLLSSQLKILITLKSGLREMCLR